MRVTSTIGVRAVQGGPVRRAPGCGAPGRGGTVRGGAGSRVELSRGLGAVSRRVEVGLTAEAVEAVAQRVAQLMRAEPVPEQRPFTAGQLAHHLGVERSWVYKHAHLLGGERIGDGPKAQWRFDLETAKAGLARVRARCETTTGA